MDREPVAVEAVAGPVGPVLQLDPDVLREVRGPAPLHGLALEPEPERPGRQAFGLGRVEAGELDHLAQDHVAPGLGPFGVAVGVVGRGPLEHPHQRRRLQPVERAGVGREVGPRGHLDPPGVVQERDRVEVELKDLVLGIDPLDLARGDGLLELARERGLVADLVGEQVPGQLLGDRRGPAQAPARRRAGRDGAPPVEVDPAVRVEPPVLGRDERLDDGRRDLVERPPLPVAPGKAGQRHAVGRDDRRRVHLARVPQVGHGRREWPERERVERDAQHKRQPSDGARTGQPAGPPGGPPPPRRLRVADAAPDVPGRRRQRPPQPRDGLAEGAGEPGERTAPQGEGGGSGLGHGWTAGAGPLRRGSGKDAPALNVRGGPLVPADGGPDGWGPDGRRP